MVKSYSSGNSTIAITTLSSMIIISMQLYKVDSLHELQFYATGTENSPAGWDQITGLSLRCHPLACPQATNYYWLLHPPPRHCMSTVERYYLNGSGPTKRYLRIPMCFLQSLLERKLLASTLPSGSMWLWFQPGVLEWLTLLCGLTVWWPHFLKEPNG